VASLFFFTWACPLQPVTTPEAVNVGIASRTKRKRFAAGSGSIPPVDDTDSSNDVLSFWVMRANTGSCAGE